MTSVEEFSCLFCQESFDSKEELQIHFRKHGDPKFNQSLKNKPQSEMAGNGDKNEDGEVVNCDVCDEVFPTISKAITHKHKMHPDHDAKYFCPWCGKLFTMKHLYNKHIQSTHDSREQGEEMGFHCDYCDVDFFVPSAVMYHNKFFHRQDTELAAIGHSKKLKMFNQEPLQIYYCPFCGEEYCNKVNLHKHMGDDHIDENQSPEDVLRCPLCEAVFYHLDAYELHLTFHSSDDQYSEENELLKEITEFSLETVPPMMEKVENESQEDEPSASMGIEELLQQGMNESDGEPRKRKKHKKHKKSKKTITLDEFLNMHSDVLGEGLDVQGIVEVPSQVVTNQLRKPQQPRLKPGPKPLPSELAKLKKAGLIIKKKPSFQGVKIANKNPVVNKTIIGNKVLPQIQSKPDTKTSSNAILSKLLNQTNSQIKIVKKSAEIISNSEVSATEKESCDNTGPEKLNEDDHEMSNNENGDRSGSNDNTNENVVQDYKKNTIEDSEPHTISSQESDNHCSTKDNVSNSQVTQEKSKIPLIETEESFSPDNKLKQLVQQPSNYIAKATTNSSINTANALRNISQHITIKSVPSPNSSHKPLMKIANDADIDKENPDDAGPKEKPAENTNTNPLSALKHLSHLTVKSNRPPEQKTITSPKIAMPTKVQQKNDEETTAISEFGDDEHEENETDIPKSTTSAVKDVQEPINSPIQHNPLKNLSKHITVKSVSPSPNNFNKVTERPNSDDNDTDDDLSLAELNKSQIEKKLIQSSPKKQFAIKSGTSLKSPEAEQCSPNNSPKVQTLPKNEVQNNEIVVYNPKIANENILKQLPNITARPMSFAKNVTRKVTAQSSNQAVKLQKGNNLLQNCVKKTETQKTEEVEIFNIDDSDEEELGPKEESCSASNRKPVTSSYKNVENNCVQDKSMAALKNLGKQITIKPKNISKPNVAEGFEDRNEMEDDTPIFDNSDYETDEIPQSLDNEINSLLQTKLNSLGNITMKPKISTPKKIASSRSSPKLKNNTYVEEYDSDSDSPSKVKITELPDDYPSDDDVPLKNNENEHESDENMMGDPEAHIEDEDDIEAQIKPTTLKKPIQNVNKTPPAFLNKLKHLTVKSVKENKDEQEDEEFPEDIDEDKILIPNKNTQLRQIKQDSNVDESQEPSNKPVRQQVRRATNHNTATSSNQINTVNKEVKVQTFQSQTVIEEITTTVTKTIRTVNQSTNQEFQSIGQKIPMRPQKIQGIRPNQQIKNYQGVSVRPGTPIRPRMRNPVMSPRPPAPNHVRPSGQLLPVRPGVNVARLSKPRMPAANKNPAPPTSNTNKPVIGRPLKISPNAIMPLKRPAPDDPTGPFSCFKKPKESLIPGHGSSDFYDTGGTSTVQYASSSQMSKSNFMSMTKTVKGNSVVTSTQMNSEVSASSEQLNRLNSMSGLKVVKTSQSKQASKVEERVEVNPAKQNALSAIEKLQRQGLLVKKPRIEEPEDSDHDDDHPDPDDMEDDYYDT